MKLDVTIEGVPDLRRRLAEIGEIVSRHHAEVHVLGARNVRLWSIHSGKSPRHVLPLRNPLFLHEESVGPLLAKLRDGVNAVLAGNAGAFPAALDAAGAVLRDSMRENVGAGRHASAGTVIATGMPMRPLSPRYAAWKRQHFPGRPILVRTGELRDSLHSRTVSTAVGGTD